MSRFIVTFLLFPTFSDPVGSMLALNYTRFDFNDKLRLLNLRYDVCVFRTDVTRLSDPTVMLHADTVSVYWTHKRTKSYIKSEKFWFSHLAVLCRRCVFSFSVDGAGWDLKKCVQKTHFFCYNFVFYDRFKLNTLMLNDSLLSFLTHRFLPAAPALMSTSFLIHVSRSWGKPEINNQYEMRRFKTSLWKQTTHWFTFQENLHLHNPTHDTNNSRLSCVVLWSLTHVSGPNKSFSSFFSLRHF